MIKKKQMHHSAVRADYLKNNEATKTFKILAYEATLIVPHYVHILSFCQLAFQYSYPLILMSQYQSPM